MNITSDLRAADVKSFMEQLELSLKSSSRDWPFKLDTGRLGAVLCGSGVLRAGRFRDFNNSWPVSGLLERSPPPILLLVTMLLLVAVGTGFTWPLAFGRMRSRHFFSNSLARLANDSFEVRRRNSLIDLPNRVVCKVKQ